MQVAESRDDSLPDHVIMHDAESAVRAYRYMKATDWRHLLVAGGLLEQPQPLFDEALMVAGLASKIEKAIEKAKRKPRPQVAAPAETTG